MITIAILNHNLFLILIPVIEFLLVGIFKVIVITNNINDDINVLEQN